MNNLSNNVAVKTSIWGPPAWFFLHSVTMAYPKKIDDNNSNDVEIKKNYYNFFMNLGNILPCNVCGNSYNKYLIELPLSDYLDSRESLFYWFYMIHEKVNDKLGVPMCDRLSLNDAIDKYIGYIANNGCIATSEEEAIKKRSLGCSNYQIDDLKTKIVFDKKKRNINNNDNNIINIICDNIIIILSLFINLILIIILILR